MAQFYTMMHGHNGLARGYKGFVTKAFQLILQGALKWNGPHCWIAAVLETQTMLKKRIVRRLYKISDRITFSAPFRRLANKTQVHPLYENDHIHHRLIHSLETASVGRSLGIAVGDWLEREHGLGSGEKHAVAGIVQAACLAHDIGNPPFGHSGEATIGSWFVEKFESGQEFFQRVDETRRAEFVEFEGNAQGFRLLSRLEMYRNDGGMRLSRSVLGAFTKYPITANIRRGVQDSYCGLKKFGIFESELDLFAEVAESVGLPVEGTGVAKWWRRHPLVFLVEAADDICYNILDLEDAFLSGEFAFDVVMKQLESLAGASKSRPVDTEQHRSSCLRKGAEHRFGHRSMRECFQRTL